PQKPNSTIPRGHNHSTLKETNIENSKKSFVSFLKRRSPSHVTPEITKPILVLDDSCIKKFKFGISLMGKAKDVFAIPNLPRIISKEGFQNVKLSYLGGIWVLFEFDSLALKEKFLNHSGIGSWFTKLIQVTSSFENNERIVWISIEGLPIKAWTPNTFHAWFPNFQQEDQDDLFSDGESQEGDVTNKADNNESDVDRVSESSFMHENDTAHKDVNSCKKGENPSMFVKEQLSTYDYFVALMGNWAPTSSKLLIISVYAPQELNERRDLWDYLRTFIDRWEGDTMIMGDFNEVRSEHERFGSTFNRQGDITFNNFISSACLIDLSLEGYAFTWAHKSASKMSKLDRYLISEGQVHDLERTVTYEEVKRAVWDYGTNKSPGQMDFPLNFTNNNNIQTLLSVLRCFYLASSLKINLHKSKLIRIGVSPNVVAAVASLIGCSILTAPFNYLGVKTRFIKAIFGNKGALDTHKLIPRRSPWQDVIVAIHSLQSKGEVALMVLYKRLYALEMCKSIIVAEKIGHPTLSHSFRKMPRSGVEQKNYGLLCSKVADLVLPNILDRWCWCLEGLQEFSVKSSRILIDNTILPKAEVPTRWLRVVPIKECYKRVWNDNGGTKMLDGGGEWCWGIKIIGGLVMAVVTAMVGCGGGRGWSFAAKVCGDGWVNGSDGD
nr:RNA-directed DNA polymerase, eukaryota [Tanacetum cinerariifolium]